MPVVEAPTSDQSDAARLRLQEIWRVAGSNEGQELAFPASVAVSATGYTAIVDYQLAEVFVVTPEGQWLGSWARRGRGPGELTMPVAANWRGDTLLVFDVEQAKVSAYREASPVGDELKIAPEYIGPVASTGEIQYVAVRADGSVLLKYPLRGATALSDSARLAVLAQQPGGARADTVASAQLPVVRWGRTSILAAPGAAQPRVAVGPNGWLATSAADGSYRILVRDAQNAAVHQVCRRVVAHPLSDAETGRAAAPTGLEDAFSAIASASPPRHLAQLGRIIVGPAGELWVDRRRPAPFTTEDLLGATGSTLDVYDGSGTFVGEVEVPSGVSVQSVSDTLAVGVLFTYLGEAWIIGYRVVDARAGTDSLPVGGITLR